MALKLAFETKLKYGISLVGLGLSMGLIVLSDLGYVKLGNTEFYKVTLATCAYSFRITSPKYKNNPEESDTNG